MVLLASLDGPPAVIARVADRLSREDLRHLSMVSRSLRKTFQPELFRSIVWIREGDASECFPPVHLLIRSILERRELGSYIKHLTVKEYRPKRAWKADTSLESKETHMIMERLSKVQGLSSPYFLQAIPLDQFVGLVIHDSTNLESISIALDERFSSKYVGHMIRSFMSRSVPPERWPSFCRSLRSVEYADGVCAGVAEQRRNPITIRHRFPSNTEEISASPELLSALSFFRLPLLSRLRIKAVELREDSDEAKLRSEALFNGWSDAKQLSMSLESLVLQDSNIREQSVEHLLRSAPNLKSFEYQFLCDCWLSEKTTIHCNDLSRALLTVKHSLKELKLSTNFYEVERYRSKSDTECGIVGRLDKLDQLTQLEHLQVPIVMLLGWSYDPKITLVDVLPRNLQRLTCTDELCSWENFEWNAESTSAQLASYVRVSSRRKLRVVRLKWVEETKEQHLWIPKTRLQIKQLCNNHGIEFDNGS